MPGSEDLNAHLVGALRNRFEIVNLKPQQDAVPIWFALPIGYRTMMMFYFEAV